MPSELKFICDFTYFPKGVLSRNQFRKFKSTVNKIVTNIQNQPNMPALYNGLCNYIYDEGSDDAYEIISYIFDADYLENYFLGEAGEWTETRMNALVLLSVLQYDDFI